MLSFVNDINIFLGETAWISFFLCKFAEICKKQLIISNQ